MAKVPPVREKFADVVPMPDDEALLSAFWLSITVLLVHRVWARDPRLFGRRGDALDITPLDIYSEARKLSTGD